MARQTINVGTAANDGTGDNLRAAGQKMNANFTELYNVAQGVSVMEYGAKGDGSTDDTAAIQAAIDTGRPVFFPNPPSGKYRITGTLNCLAHDGQHIFGLSSATTSIEMDQTVSPNKPMILIGGARKVLKGLQLLYWPAPSSTDTNAIAIKIDKLAWSIIEDVRMYRVGTGMEIAQTAKPTDPTGYVGTENYAFSNTFRDIQIGYPTCKGIYFRTVNSASTGNVFSNVYINGYTDAFPAKTLVTHCWHMEEHDSTLVQTCNIEHIRFSQECFSNVVVRGLDVSALHFEGVEPTTFGRAIMTCAGGRYHFRGVDVIYSSFLTGNSNTLGILQVTNSTRVVMEGLTERGNTVTSTDVRKVYSWDTFTTASNTGVWFKNCEFSTAFATNGALSGTPTRPVIRQLNDVHYLPTQAGLADLATGELYVDTAASNVIKRKP